jgi:hypothetical protein
MGVLLVALCKFKATELKKRPDSFSTVTLVRNSAVRVLADRLNAMP